MFQGSVYKITFQTLLPCLLLTGMLKPLLYSIRYLNQVLTSRKHIHNEFYSQRTFNYTTSRLVNALHDFERKKRQCKSFQSLEDPPEYSFK